MEPPSDPPPAANTAIAASTAADALPPLAAGFLCPECDYDLRSLTGNRCPECGFSLDGLRAAESAIPWVHRARIGRIRAYWETVGIATLHGRQLKREVMIPVDLGAAQRFRRLTVLHAYPALLAVSLAALVRWWNEAERFAGVLTIPTWLALQLGLALFLLAATALPGHFFHPRRLPIEKQNRAVALSYYACAALAWLPIYTVLLALGVLAFVAPTDQLDWFVMFHWPAAALVLLKWWADLLRLARRATRAGPFRLLLIAVGVPLLWAVVGVLIFCVIPAVVLYVGIIVDSLL